MNIFEEFFLLVPAVLIAISMHEFAHGYVSYKLGDPTPKVNGRISLNPLVHLDLLGALSLILFRFGWARPVEINARYYKNKKLGVILVSLAGPFINFILAFLSILFMGIMVKIFQVEYSIPLMYLLAFIRYFALINIGLAIFNLIPIPPLDGSKVLWSILPSSTYFSYMRYERYGMLFLLIFLSFGFLSGPLVSLQSEIYDGFMNIVNFLLTVI